MIKYIFFDVAGTLLGKPSLYTNIQSSISEFGYDISIEEIKNKHKLLSEVIHFPDRTDEQFYKKFNSELLYLLGIVPNEDILTLIFKNCTYLPWQKFDDTKILNDINIPMGIISNFNSTLKDKITFFFGSIFQDILVSEEIGVAKPNILFYKEALNRISLSPQDVLYIGDSIKLDLEPSQSLGMNTLIIDRDNFYPSQKHKISNLAEIINFL
jgi:putative hydrolase of the HAD superfamily